MLLVICYYPERLANPVNYIEATPTKTPKHIIPEWYFLPLYSILKMIPSKLDGILIMISFLIFPALLPLTSFNNEVFMKNILKLKTLALCIRWVTRGLVENFEFLFSSYTAWEGSLITRLNKNIFNLKTVTKKKILNTKNLTTRVNFIEKIETATIQINRNIDNPRLLNTINEVIKKTHTPIEKIKSKWNNLVNKDATFIKNFFFNITRSLKVRYRGSVRFLIKKLNKPRLLTFLRSILIHPKFKSLRSIFLFPLRKKIFKNNLLNKVNIKLIYLYSLVAFK